MYRFMRCAVFFLLLFGSGLCFPCRAAESRRVPILMYHDFSADEEEGEYCHSAALFSSHLDALRKAGFETVVFGDLIRFVDGSGELPEKCVVLTSDDGYRGVTETAVPICCAHGMRMSCAVIGSLCGRDSAHFLPDERISDALELTSHTFALHDPTFRDAVELLPDALRMQSEFGSRFPMTALVLVYPHGVWSAEAERVLRETGYRVTVTCRSGISRIEQGREESLWSLPRISVTRGMTADELLRAIGV